jgi:excisionase family DNA binding protein
MSEPRLPIGPGLATLEREIEQSNNVLMTVHEVAQQLRIDDTTCRRWIKNGAMEAVSLPHLGKRQSYRVRRSTLDNILQATTTVNA